ncbi:hypothetical protein ACFQ6O_29995 [Streptomyces sp. NPDC056441]|uniref:hypothetical protein n=1 Tax=Streptomyces sp. NPDC056441 TaxID=3345817 RepID=UPI003677C260
MAGTDGDGLAYRGRLRDPGSGDFDLADLNSVRRRFTDRHVTLDGDVITVWPPAPQEMPEGSARVAVGAGD